MQKFELTDRLQGDIGEMVFQHYCRHNGKKQYAFLYIKTEEILYTLKPDNILKFRFENQSVKVTIPDEIEDEIRRICRPSNGNPFAPTFTPDYLSVPIGNFFKIIDERLRQVKPIPAKYFNWIEVKTNNAPLSKNQQELKRKTKIGLKVFRIKTEFPKVFDVIYDKG